MLRKSSQLKRALCLQSAVLKRCLHAVLNVQPSTHLQEQENQASYLTKTLVYHDTLPTTYSQRVSIPDDERNAIRAAVKKSIIETNYFHRDEALMFPRRPRWTAHRKAWKMEEWKNQLTVQVLINMLRIVWSAKCYQEVGAQTLTYRSDLVAPWERFGKKVQVSGKHGHLVSGKSLLGLFAGEEEVSNTAHQELQWSDVISPFFDMPEVKSNYVANRGLHDGAPYPCPQTLMLTNSIRWKDRFHTGNAVFFSFAQAMTYALSQGEVMGKDLVNPVPMQCIVFDGSSFYFVFYQLNTLNFSDDNQGIKNMAWIINNQKLYGHVSDRQTQSLLGTEEEESLDFIEYTAKRTSLVDFDRKKLTETLSNEETRKVYIEGFNKTPVDMFVNILLNQSP